MACCTGIDARDDGRLVLEDAFSLKGDPIALEGTVLGVIVERQGGFQLLEALDESAVGKSGEFGEFFSDIVDALCGA